MEMISLERGTWKRNSDSAHHYRQLSMRCEQTPDKKKNALSAFSEHGVALVFFSTTRFRLEYQKYLYLQVM